MGLHQTLRNSWQPGASKQGQLDTQADIPRILRAMVFFFPSLGSADVCGYHPIASIAPSQKAAAECLAENSVSVVLKHLDVPLEASRWLVNGLPSGN